MARDDPHMMRVRLDPEIMDWLRRTAEANCRSMTGEISFRLKAAMAAAQAATEAAVDLRPPPELTRRAPDFGDDYERRHRPKLEAEPVRPLGATAAGQASQA